MNLHVSQERSMRSKACKWKCQQQRKSIQHHLFSSISTRGSKIASLWFQVGHRICFQGMAGWELALPVKLSIDSPHISTSASPRFLETTSAWLMFSRKSKTIWSHLRVENSILREVADMKLLLSWNSLPQLQLITKSSMKVPLAVKYSLVQ